MSPMVERSRVKVSREADAVVGRVRVTAKDRPELLEAIANSPDFQKMLRDGRRRIKQFDAWDQEAEKIAGLTPDKRRRQESRLRQINNERYPQLAIIARQLGDTTRHNGPFGAARGRLWRAYHPPVPKTLAPFYLGPLRGHVHAGVSPVEPRI